MTIDAILASAGSSRSDLDSTVTQYRQMSAGCEMVLADHFNVEDLATVIETLAVKLDRIRALAAPFIEDHWDERGELARGIEEVLRAGDPEDAIAVVDRTVSSRLAGTLSTGAERLYGHPDLAAVSHFAVDLESLSHTLLRHLVHTPSGRVFEVPEKDTVEDAAAAFEKDLAGA